VRPKQTKVKNIRDLTKIRPR